MAHRAHRRTRRVRRLLSIAATLGTLATVSACTGEPPPLIAPTTEQPSATSTSAPTETNTPVETSPAAPTATEVTPTIVCPAEGPPLTAFTGPAATHFGADTVMDAYCEVAAFFVQRGVTSLTDPRTRTATAARDLRFVTDRLTVQAAQRWNQALAAAGTSVKAEQSLRDLTYYRIAPPRGYHYPSDGPMSVDAQVSTAAADVAQLPDKRHALALWFTVTNAMPLSTRPNAAPTHAVTLTRKVAVYLVPNPAANAPADQSWLIESWTTSWNAAQPVSWPTGR
jgi:hypothetical protein